MIDTMKILLSNGDIYEGEHLNGVPHGIGKVKMINGNFYDGS